MAKATITIIGLGRRGCSIGLALQKPELEFEVIGHDSDSLVAKEARSKGAVDKTPWNLIEACLTADVVILAIPFDQVRPTLKAIGQDLKAGAVVLDTSILKQPAIDWAEEFFADEAYFVGIALGTNPDAMMEVTHGPEGARADLFADSSCCIVPSPTCRPEAVKTAQDVAVLLGSDPFFLDPTEFDGLSTTINLLPAVLSAALLGPVTASPSWREMRRLSALSLMRATQPLENGGAALAQALSHRSDNIVHWLNVLIEELQKLREQMQEGDTELLTAQLNALNEEREEWLADWERNRWEKMPGADVPATGGMLTSLFGGLGRKRRSDKES